MSFPADAAALYERDVTPRLMARRRAICLYRFDMAFAPFPDA